MTAAVIFAEPGKVSAIRHRWTFDEYYTSSIVGQNGTSAAGLQAFADGALANLRLYEYFTHLRIGGGAALQTSAARPSATLQGKRLTLEFEILLQTPADIRNRQMLLSVYDPTYYIEMLYGESRAITFVGEEAAACRATIVPAKPAEDVKRRAFDMDRQATPDHTLGEKFAERVEITCGH